MRLALTVLAIIVLTKGVSAQENSQKYAKELAKNGKYKEAVEVMDVVIKSNSRKASYYLDKTSYLLKLKQYEDALRTLSTAIQIMPDSIVLYESRASLLDAFNFNNESIQDYTTAYEKAEGNKLRAHLLANRGGMKNKVRDFDGAYSDLVLALELDSTSLEALNNIAISCDEGNRKDETLKYLEKVISIDSTFAPAYINIGHKLQLLDQHEKAIGYFNKAIKLAPKESFCYSNRSFSRLKTKDIDGAMEDIEYSIKLMPMNSWAFKVRALIKIEKRKKKSACEDLAMANELGYTKQYGEEVNELIAQHCK